MALAAVKKQEEKEETSEQGLETNAARTEHSATTSILQKNFSFLRDFLVSLGSLIFFFKNWHPKPLFSTWAWVHNDSVGPPKV
jgi:hypothetical protein